MNAEHIEGTALLYDGDIQIAEIDFTAEVVVSGNAPMIATVYVRDLNAPSLSGTMARFSQPRPDEKPASEWLAAQIRQYCERYMRDEMEWAADAVARLSETAG